MDPSNPSQRKGNAIVHVREDSETDLEKLFNPRINSASLPMRDRKLPPSFFKPPSALLAFGARAGVDQTKDPNELGYSHSRAHSSPASFHHQQQNSQRLSSAHQRTQSYDALESEPLPPGWEGRTTATGQKYFVNHIDRSTSWTHPRLKSQSLATLNANQTLGTLPEGWEQGVTPEGEVYYINHATQTTTWYDPRLGNRNQNANAANFMQGQPPRAPQEQQVNLRYLQLEKEKLRQRQRQIFHQEMLIQRQMTSQSDPVVSGASLINSLCQEKFANSSNFASVQHKRVGSADSGLDGMGSFLSPPSSDVDVLSGIDDVDMEGNIPQQQMKDSLTRRSDPTNLNQINQINPGHLPEFFDRMPATNVDLGILEPDTDIGTGLEGLQSDVLNDVDMMLSPSHNNKVKDGFLTWL